VRAVPAGWVHGSPEHHHRYRFRSDGIGAGALGDTLAALRFVSENPIVGAGVGMNILAMNDVRGARWKEVHNVYLEYAVDLGLPGLILFLAILAGCFRSVALVRRRTAGSPRCGICSCSPRGSRSVLRAFVVAAVFHPVAYHFYFYYMAGLALAARATWEGEMHGVTP